jgi:hypothetical protein
MSAVVMSALCQKRTYAAQQSITVYWDMYCESRQPVARAVRFWQIVVTSRRLPSWLVRCLFFSVKKVQEVSVNLVVLDRAKLELMLTSDVLLLAPAKE